MVVEWSTAGVEVLLIPTFELRLDVGLDGYGDRMGLEEALVEIRSRGVRWGLVSGESIELAFG